MEHRSEAPPEELRTLGPNGWLRVLQERGTSKKYGSFVLTGNVVDLRSDENGESSAHLDVDENVVVVAVESVDGRRRPASIQSGENSV